MSGPCHDVSVFVRMCVCVCVCEQSVEGCSEET